MLGLQKQLWLFEQTLPKHRAALFPGGVQFCCLPRAEVMPGKSVGHPLAIGAAQFGYRRQVLRRHMRRYLAFADLLLDAFRQPVNQGQPPRHPPDPAVKLSRQFFNSVPAMFLEFGQQPALFQGRQARTHLDRSGQHQRLGCRQRPDHRFDGIVPELLERGDPFVAVDDLVLIGLVGGHHHNRRLLSVGRKRRHQPPLGLRLASTQVFPPPLELVKFQSHPSPSWHGSTMDQVASRLSAPGGHVCR
jgi:hypothetical protein